VPGVRAMWRGVDSIAASPFQFSCRSGGYSLSGIRAHVSSSNASVIKMLASIGRLQSFFLSKQCRNQLAPFDVLVEALVGLPTLFYKEAKCA